MTTSSHLDRTRNGVTLGDKDERARAAVKVFRSMQFSLTGYARAITGDKKVAVEMASGAPRTDGKKIMYQPPIALGDKTPHQRKLCDKRDPETMVLTCPACAVREEVLVNIYHEIGHIAFGSFQHTTDRDQREALEKAIDEWGGKYTEQIKRRFNEAPFHVRQSYLGLARLVSPFLPYIVNCIEDARVDSAMFKARPGVRTMMQASSMLIFTQGNERPDGTREMWKDAPLNSQASIACYLAGAGIVGWRSWLHSEVVTAFDDPELMELVESVKDCKTASDTYSLSFPVLAKLREHGFFKMPEDEEQDESDEAQDEAEADSSDGSGDPSDDEPGEEGESGDGEAADEGGDDESSSDEDGAGSSPNGDQDSETTEEEGVGDEAGEEGASSGDPVPAEPGESGDESDDGDREDSQSSEAGDSDAGHSEDDGSSGDADEADGTEGGGGGEDDSEHSDVSDPSSGSDEEGAGTSPSDADDSGEAEEQSAGQEGSDSDSSSANESDTEDGSGDGDAGAEHVGSGSEGSGSEDSEQLNDGTEGGESGSRTGALGTDDTDTDEDAEGDHEGDPVPESDPSTDGDTTKERIDTGADDGTGGLEIEEESKPEYGTVEDVKESIEQFHKNDVEDARHGETPDEESAIQVAIIQGLYFEKPSQNIGGVREHKFDQPLIGAKNNRLDTAWSHDRLLSYMSLDRDQLGIDCDLDVPESVLGPALLQTRRVFTDNAIAAHQHNRKSGRVHRKVLGRRAWNDDDRLFTKKRLPGKRSYGVILGIDVSGSTIGENLALAKRAAWAQAELCARAGVDFAVYAHSANSESGAYGRNDLWLDIYEIKAFDEPWDSKRQFRLRELASDSENLDGHTIEYYRKRLDEIDATDKILLYYTDGKMPAANHDEELEILQRELKTFKQRNYTILGVGIRTDSPRRHGLDTVQVDSDEDLKSVVMHLEKRLVRPGR